jgi:hypothetical protein
MPADVVVNNNALGADDPWEPIRRYLGSRMAADARWAASLRGEYNTIPLHLAGKSRPPTNVVMGFARGVPGHGVVDRLLWAKNESTINLWVGGRGRGTSEALAAAAAGRDERPRQ